MFRPMLAIIRFFIRKNCMLYGCLYKAFSTRLNDLYKHSYSIQFFQMKNLMMANIGRNM